MLFRFMEKSDNTTAAGVSQDAVIKRIKLIVYNNYTLGYILPELPNRVQHLRTLFSRGGTWSMSEASKFVSPRDSIRLASEKDFDEFGVSFDGYREDNHYEYAPDSLREYPLDFSETSF